MMTEYEPVFDLLDSLLDGPISVLHLHPDYVAYRVWGTALGNRWLTYSRTTNLVELTPQGRKALAGHLRMKQFQRENVWQWWMPALTTKKGVLL